jgi:hypothetical protein
MEFENKLNLNEMELDNTRLEINMDEAELSSTEEYGLFNSNLWQSGSKKQQAALDLLNGL